MTRSIRIVLSIVVVIFMIGFFGFVMPSLIGLLIAILILISINDFFLRRRQHSAKTFNSAAQSVCHREGAINKVALAFARSGALRGPCYEYARRLMVGEDPIDSAARSGVPLHLTTAVAMATRREVDRSDPSNRSDLSDIVSQDTVMMPAYAHIIYLVITAMVTCSVLSFVSIFIVPSMEKIMQEFGLATPYLWLIAGDTPTLTIMALVMLALLLLTPIMSRGSFFGIPVPSWMPRSPRSVEAKSETLHGLADAIEAGMTVDQALQLATRISLSRSERNSLAYANSLIRQGSAPADALLKSGWLSARESDWVRGATATRGAELLHTIADQRVRDANANIRWAMEIVFPLIVIMLGIAILCFAYGLFGSLMSLINGLA